MRGRKPAPTPLKILRGEQKSRVNQDEPISPAVRPECPAYLDEVAREEWGRQVERMEAMQVLTQADGPALAIYCSVYSRWHRAQKELDASLTATTAAGNAKSHPALGVIERCEERMMKLLVEFGGTPASRTRIKVGGEKPANKLGLFLDKRKKKRG